MRAIAGAVALAILGPTGAIAQSVVIVTQRINTGTCTPANSVSGSSAGAPVLYTTTDANGNVIIGTEAATGYLATLTNSLGSIIVESVTSDYIPGPQTVESVTYTDSAGSVHVGLTTEPVPVLSTVEPYSYTDASGGVHVGTSTVAEPGPSTGAAGGSTTSGATNTPQPISTSAPGGLPQADSIASYGGSTSGGQPKTFQVYSGIDFPGADIPQTAGSSRQRLQTSGANSIGDCLTVCADYEPPPGGPRCVAASYDGKPNGSCYLKSAIVALNTDAGDFTAGKIESYVPDVPPVIVSFTPGSPEGSAIVSQDVASQSAVIASSDSVVAAASTTVVATLTSGTSVVPVTSVIGDTSATAEASTEASPSATETLTPSPTDPVYPCPSLDGQAYDVGDSGDSFIVSCSTDYTLNDLTTPTEDTFADCISACDSYVPDPTVANGQSCVAAVFAANSSDGNCYLKYAVTSIKSDSGFEAAALSNYTLPSQSASSVGSAAVSSTATMGTSETAAAPSTTAGPTDTGVASSASAVGSSDTGSSIMSESAGASSSGVVASTSPASSPPATSSSPAASSSSGGESATAVSSTSMASSMSSASSAAPSSSSAPGSSSASSASTGSASSSASSSSPGSSSASASSSSPPSSSSSPASSSASSSGSSSGTSTASSATSTATSGSTSNSNSNSNSSPATQPPPACGAVGASTNTADGTPITDALDETYTFSCGKNFGFDNTKSSYATSFEGCLIYCDLTPQCNAVTYSSEANEDNCYPRFKGQPNEQTYNTDAPQNNLYGGYVGTANTASSISQNLCGSPSSDGKTTKDQFGNTYKIGCAQSLSGTQLTTLDGSSNSGSKLTTLLACLTLCSSITGCKGVVFNGYSSSTGQNTLTCFPYGTPGTFQAFPSSVTPDTGAGSAILQ